jgi:hypothetical protein
MNEPARRGAAVVLTAALVALLAGVAALVIAIHLAMQTL